MEGLYGLADRVLRTYRENEVHLPNSWGVGHMRRQVREELRPLIAQWGYGKYQREVDRVLAERLASS